MALEIRKSIEVNASVETLWRVLTDNAFIPQYMFGCIAETDWQPGSPLLWRGAADGKLYVKGAIVKNESPHRLDYTIIDPNNPAVPDIPENYLTMQYILRPRGNACTLEIIQGDYATVANGQERYQHTVNANNEILPAIKKLAEVAG